MSFIAFVDVYEPCFTDQSLDSMNQPVEDEEGLPSPPLDEGALFATQTNSIQFSEVHTNVG